MYDRVLAHANCLVEVEEWGRHVSAIEIANYHDVENVAIECVKCNEVIIDFDRPEQEELR